MMRKKFYEVATGARDERIRFHIVQSPRVTASVVALAAPPKRSSPSAHAPMLRLVPRLRIRSVYPDEAALAAN
jgi:hypothetical protein